MEVRRGGSLIKCVDLFILSRDKFSLARKGGDSKTELSFTCLLSWCVVARSPGCSLIEGRFVALILDVVCVGCWRSTEDARAGLPSSLGEPNRGDIAYDGVSSLLFYWSMEQFVVLSAPGRFPMTFGF